MTDAPPGASPLKRLNMLFSENFANLEYKSQKVALALANEVFSPVWLMSINAFLQCGTCVV